MEFRRIEGMPPYVFTIIDTLKKDLRRAGHDIIDLGFGNPDIPSPELAVEKLAEAAGATEPQGWVIAPTDPDALTEFVAGEMAATAEEAAAHIGRAMVEQLATIQATEEKLTKMKEKILGDTEGKGLWEALLRNLRST